MRRTNSCLRILQFRSGTETEENPAIVDLYAQKTYTAISFLECSTELSVLGIISSYHHIVQIPVQLDQQWSVGYVTLRISICNVIKSDI